MFSCSVREFSIEDFYVSVSIETYFNNESTEISLSDFLEASFCSLSSLGKSTFSDIYLNSWLAPNIWVKGWARLCYAYFANSIALATIESFFNVKNEADCSVFYYYVLF